MKALLIVKLVLTTLLCMATNVAISYGVVAVYAYGIRPGEPEQHYLDFALASAPYSSILAGIPLLFLLGWWVSRWRSVDNPPAAVGVVWLTYAVLDVGILLGTGSMNPRMAVFSGISLVTKLLAGLAGAKWGSKVA